MEKQGKVFVVDDNEDVLFALNYMLEPYVEKVKVTTQPSRIEHFMTTFQPDVILLDMNFSRDVSSGQEGYYWLDKILTIDPKAVVIFITAYTDTEKVVRAIKAGATDFVSKPWDKEKLLAIISSGVKLRRSRMEEAKTKETYSTILSEPKSIVTFISFLSSTAILRINPMSPLDAFALFLVCITLSFSLKKRLPILRSGISSS